MGIAWEMSDDDLGNRILEMAENRKPSDTSVSEFGKSVREMFSHCCQGEMDKEVARDLRSFSIYMKEAWKTPEGERSTYWAQQLLHRFKRHEEKLREIVEESPDYVIMAATQMIKEYRRICEGKKE